MWAGRSEELSGLCCFGEATSMADSCRSCRYVAACLYRASIEVTAGQLPFSCAVVGCGSGAGADGIDE